MLRRGALTEKILGIVTENVVAPLVGKAAAAYIIMQAKNKKDKLEKDHNRESEK